MEILDPDLWNDDGTPKRPSQEYMRRLEEMQDLEAVTPGTPAKRAAEVAEALSQFRRQAKELRTPEIGDIAHWWDGEHCRAAMVMEVETSGHGAWLRVHIPNKPFEDWQSDHDESKEMADSWHWPCEGGQRTAPIAEPAT